MASFEWPPRGTSGGGGGGGSGSLVKATLYDPVDTTLPSGATATIDGVSVTNGMTVLFSNLGAGNNIVKTASGVGTSIVWTDAAVFGSGPSITPTAGDQVIFTQGTAFADQVATFNGTTWTVNLFVRYFNGADYWELSSINTVTLTNNTTANVYSIAFLGSENQNVNYSIIRGAVKEIGNILITTDGVTANSTVTSDNIGVSGVTFSTDISGSNVRLRYTTTNTGSDALMKFYTSRWSDAAGGPGGIPSYSSAAGSAWDISGNSGTTAGANFIGTTDAQDLVFKTNNVETMRIIQGTGEVHIPGKLTVDGLIDPTQVLLTGADKKFGATDAGAVYLAPFTDGAGSVEIRMADDVTPVFSVNTSTPSVTITGTLNLSAGSNNTFAGFDNSGHLESVPGFSIDTTSGGMNQVNIENPNNNGGAQVNGTNTSFIPLQNSPNETWSIHNEQVFLDPTSTGFSFGTSGACINFQGNSVTHSGTGNVGSLNFTTNNFNLGNGTDPIDIRGIGYNFGLGVVNANVTVSGQVQGYGFQPSFNAASFLTSQVNAFYDFANIPISVDGYTSFTATPIIGNITNNNNYNGFNNGPTITTLSGNAGYTGINISPTIGTVGTGQISGIVFNGSATNVMNANGISVDVSNYVVFPGVSASLIEQDLSFAAVDAGTNGNSITITYTAGATAGSEVVTYSGSAFTVQIENGVSTANQILAAVQANTGFSFYINSALSGVGSNPQNTFGPTNLSGGVNKGTKHAANLGGDITSTGNFALSGNFNCQKFNSNGSTTIIDNGTNSIGQVDFLVTTMTAGSGKTIANSDTIGINCASLINIGAGSTLTSGAFGLGLASLILPAVVTMGAGSSLDHLTASAFALNLSGGGAGTISNAILCRAVAIPNGTTTVSKLFGFKFDLPFGDPGTQTWGFYSEPNVNNWINGSLKIGGTAGSTDVVTGGYKLDVEGKVLIQTSLDLQDPGAGTNKIVIQSPTLSSDWTLTLPVDDGTPGQVLSTDGSGVTSWVTSSSGAAGAPTEIQFNTGGAFDADSDFTWDSTNNILGLASLQIVGLNTTTLSDNTTGTVLTYDKTSFSYVILEYGVVRNGDNQVGRLMIVTNGTTVSISDDNTSTDTLGITFSAAVSGANINLNYTTTNTGFIGTMDYSIRRWG